MARIVVSGYMVRHPLAGNVATFFQYVLGLHRLGHEVLYLEEKGWEWSCYEPTTGRLEQYPRTGLSMVRRLVDRYCPGVPIIYVDAEGGHVEGMAWDEVQTALASCDLLLDVGGMCWLPERLAAPRRAVVDCDPLFTQVGLFGARVLEDYHVHFTYGVNVGRHDCTVPTGGIDWLPAWPPVVSDLWEAPPPEPGLPFTTVANWSAYGSVTHDGVWYGQKDVEFRRLLDLPSRVSAPLEIALSGADDDVRDELGAAGWRVGDGGNVTATVEAYRAYMADSQGEFSVAKHGYVSTRSGWFSERTVCYLAAGRPAVVQDTGFTSWLPSGRGVVAFTTPDEAADAIERVVRELPTQSLAAQELAASTFDYRVVLPSLLDRALAPLTLP